MTPPSHIGQYRIIRKIGAGGMGLVYLGEHTLLGRRAAVKTLLPTVAANQEVVERFFNEARATSAIADPGVIQIYDFGYHVDGTAYIVMELLEGEALSARLDRLGRLALGDALRFGRQITGSLAAAHAKNIVHRDLKPENIFLVRDAEAPGGERTKIIDFGICKVGSGDPNLTEVGAMIGTPVYMSPEQCRGSGDVDPRSDIYAFGCLLFHLVTGRPPFVGQTSGDLILAHLQEEPPPPSRFAPELPPAADALVLRCLAKEPGERFASMVELAGALGVLAALPEAASQGSATPPRTVPLGRGFRSVYDANLRAALGKSALFTGAAPGLAGLPATHPLRAKLQFSPPPESPPEDSAELATGSRGRAAVRAALACVLVVGVTLGLVITLMLGDGGDRPAVRTGPVALPVEALAPAAPAPAAPLVHASPPGDVALPSALEPDDESDRAAPHAAPAPDRPTASKLAAAPRPRTSSEQRAAKAIASASRTSRSSGSASSRSSRPPPSPPPARTAPAPAPPAPAPALPPAPSAASVPPAAALAAPAPSSQLAPSTEDLYDGR